jgi:hypothetical protein
MSTPTMTGTSAEGSDSPTHERRPGGPSPSGGGSALERVTVNLSGRSVAALDALVQLTGDTKTDSINKALQVYSYVRQLMHDGGRLYARETPQGEAERLHIF